MIVATLLALGEVSRWWGDPRFIPLAFDEIFVAGAMLWAAVVGHRMGAAPMAAAWGLFCGLIISLLTVTLDHLFYGPPKESAVFYAVILGGVLAVGLWSIVRALGLSRVSSHER